MVSLSNRSPNLTAYNRHLCSATRTHLYIILEELMTPAVAYENLEDAIQAAGSPVEMLRNSQIGPYAFPVVPAEFTNWRDEQRSWRDTCALFDQSHHMTDLYVEGPDALKVFSDLGVNTFKNFKVNQAK